MPPPFEPGNKFSKGRPPGSLNKKTAFQKALEGRGADIVKKIRLLAMDQDPIAMKLCLERLIPKAKPPNSRFFLPPIHTAAGIKRAISAVAKAVANGVLTAREGESVSRILDSQRRAIESAEFEARIRVLENAPPRLEHDS